MVSITIIYKLLFDANYIYIYIFIDKTILLLVIINVIVVTPIIII